MGISHYDSLIEIIKEALQKREDDKIELRKISEKTSRRMYGFRFTSFIDLATREEFIHQLVARIAGVENFLELVAGRNHNRHKELVSLLVEQFEIEHELENMQPHGSGGFLHEQLANERLDAVKKRIEVIISEKDAEV